MDALLRRLVYRSRAVVPFRRDEIDALLHHARSSNAIDGISGLLWSDGTTFVQTLEGPPDSVEDAFDRISRDGRHHGIEILSDQETMTRSFGTWYMAGSGLTGQPTDEATLALAIRNAPDDVRISYPPGGGD